MEPSSPSASDTMSASQSLTALTAFTAATADLKHAKQLIVVHSRMEKVFKSMKLDVKTEGTLNELNRTIKTRLRRRLAAGQSQFMKASKAYTEATGIATDGTTMFHPEPSRIPTAAEFNDLLCEVQKAQDTFPENNTIVDADDLEDIYSEYEKVLCADQFMPKE